MPTEIVCSRCQREIPPFNPPVSLRDYFAAQALMGTFAQVWHPEMGCDWRWTVDERVVHAYEVADAMLAERAK